jgi:two-component system, NarL family, nitrate/nitrite response regulator NarL
MAVSDEIRIVIADDHAVVRKGLCASIGQETGMRVVAEASDGEVALALIRKHLPDVAVVDIDMPKLDGFEVAREIIRQGIKAKLIFLTLHTDEELFRAALDLGVAGYILKDSAMEEISLALRTVAAGQPYLSSAMTARLLRAPKPASATPEIVVASLLTPAERRILQLIARGKSSKEIGAELSIHYRTVENHRSNICRKLSLEGANALVRYALQNKTSL